MKISLFMLPCLLLASVTQSQLKGKVDCPEISVDFLEGKVNGLKPDATHERIKSLLPCFTGAVEKDDSTAKCGGKLSYKDNDIYFYTDRDYVEVGPRFKGKISLPLLGAKRSALFQYLGNPSLKNDTWEAFQTSYGIMVLHFDKAGEVNLVQFSTEGASTLRLCE